MEGSAAAVTTGIVKGPGFEGEILKRFGIERISKGPAKSRVSMLSKIRKRMRSGVLGRGLRAMVTALELVGNGLEMKAKNKLEEIVD